MESISKMKPGNWNYKSQRSSNLRHYGPRAQEVYKVFRKG
ncbi:tail fiber domain-containing protein [Maribellus comscasis]